MNKFYIKFFVCVLCVAMASCSQKVSQDSLPGDKSLSLSVDHIDILPTGSSVSIAFTADGVWSMYSTDESWLDVSQKSGKEGTYNITVSADVNRTRADRSATLVFKSSGETPQFREIPVNQPHPYLNVSIVDDSGKTVIKDDSVLFAWNQSKQNMFSGYKIEVKSNVDWKIVVDEAYHSYNYVVSLQEGFGDATVTFNTEKNNIDKCPFISVMHIDAYMPGGISTVGDGVNTYRHNLRQKNLRFLLDDSCDDINVSIDELNKEIKHGTILVDSELPWKVKHCPDWVEWQSSLKLMDTLRVKADGVNPVLEQRKDSIVLQSEGLAERVIQIVQSPYIFSLSEKTVTMPNKSADTLAVELKTTGTWELSNVPEWLVAEPLSGEGDAKISFTCPDQNLELEDMVQAVVFKSKLNSIKDEVNVTQKKFLFNVTPDEMIAKIPTFSTKLYDVKIESSGNWTVSADKDWVSVETDTEADLFKAGCKSGNPDIDNDRTATITVVSETHKARGITLEREVNLLQRKFVFELNTETTSVPAYTKSKTFVLDIDCTSNWEITEHPSWLTPDKTSGEESGSVSFTISTNSSMTSTRTGKITVKSLYNSKFKSTPTLTQDKFVFKIDKSYFSSLSPVDAADCEVNVICTDEAAWSLTSQDWIVASSSKGEGSGQIVFKPKDNPKTSSRSSNVSLTCDPIGMTYDLTFSQDSYKFSSGASSSYSLGALETAVKSFSLTCSGDWEIETGSNSWLVFDSKSGKGDATVKFHLDKNVDTSERSADVTIYSKLQKGTSDELKSTFKVKQKAYEFNSDPVTLSMPTLNDDSALKYSAYVTCSGDWVVNNLPSWISASKTSGSSNATIDFVPSTNTDMEARSAVIEIVSKDNSSLKKVVTANQSAYVFNLDKTTASVGSAQSQVACVVTATSSWTVNSDKDWLTLSAATGTGIGSVTATAAKNETGKERSAVVTFQSKHGHKATLTITQSK